MSDAVQVTVDDSDLRRALGQLVAGLDRQIGRGAQRVAADTAAAVRVNVPVRSGRLAATVRPVWDSDGGAVTYGGGLPYADYIERRAHAVARGVAGAAPRWITAMEAAAETEVRAL